MILLVISAGFWILILIYNAIYSFLPLNIQSIKWVQSVAIVAAVLILIGGIVQVIREYRAYRFVYIRSSDGAILKEKNFPWKITKTVTKEGAIVYIVNERCGDASEITVKLDKPVKFQVYNAIDGVAVRFICDEAIIPNFKIVIKN